MSEKLLKNNSQRWVKFEGEHIVFPSRQVAGEKLATFLQQSGLARQDAVVVGVTRGGVVVAAAIAAFLQASLDCIVVKKLGAPGNPELAIGAVCADGSRYYNEFLLKEFNVKKWQLRLQEAKKRSAAKKAERIFHKSSSRQSIARKEVILVDDGIATGATVFAALHSLKRQGASKIIVVAPVCALDTGEEMRNQGFQTVFLREPRAMQSVGNYYEAFPQVANEEVVALLKRAR